MKPNFYKLLERAVEEGVAYGYMRAYKYQDNPSVEHIQSEIYQGVMNSICEWFQLDDQTSQPSS